MLMCVMNRALPRQQLNQSDVNTPSPMYLHSVSKTCHNFWHATSFTADIQKITAAHFLTLGV